MPLTVIGRIKDYPCLDGRGSGKGMVVNLVKEFCGVAW